MIIRITIARFPNKNKALGFKDILTTRFKLLPEAKLKIAMTCLVGEAKVVTIGIYRNAKDVEAGKIISQEIINTIKTMDGSYEVLPGKIAAFFDAEAEQQLTEYE